MWVLGGCFSQFLLLFGFWAVFIPIIVFWLSLSLLILSALSSSSPLYFSSSVFPPHHRRHHYSYIYHHQYSHQILDFTEGKSEEKPKIIRCTFTSYFFHSTFLGRPLRPRIRNPFSYKLQHSLHLTRIVNQGREICLLLYTLCVYTNTEDLFLLVIDISSFDGELKRTQPKS